MIEYETNSFSKVDINFGARVTTLIKLKFIYIYIYVTYDVYIIFIYGILY